MANGPWKPIWNVLPRKRALGAVFVVLLVALAGCSSGGTGNTTTTGGAIGNGTSLADDKPTTSVTPADNDTSSTDTKLSTTDSKPATSSTPVVFVRASDIGLTGTELPADIDHDDDLRERIEQIRAQTCAELGIVDESSDATGISPGFPKVAFVSEPHTYETSTEPTAGSDTNYVRKDDIDITARIMSMQYLHPTYAVTGATLIPISRNFY